MRWRVEKGNVLGWTTSIIYMNESVFKTSKKRYKQAGKCDHQQQFKDIFRLLFFLLLKDSPTTVPMKSTPVKKRSAQKQLCIFTNILNVNNKTA